MAKDKKMVDAITSMDEDFAKWYTDICMKAELVSYTSVKGCMVIRPYGYAYGRISNIYLTQSSRSLVMKMFVCLCLFLRACFRRRKTTLRALLLR